MKNLFILNQNHLNGIKEKTVSLCLLGILVIAFLPGCKNPPASTAEKSIPNMPMKAPAENSLAWEVSQKPALESKLLSDMESLENWEPWVDPLAYGTISLSNDTFYKGKASVMLTSPTKGERQPASNSDNQVFDALIPGRPWGSSSAIYRVDNEDWTEWNRITLWVYPDLPGFRTVSFNIVLHNDTREDTTVTLEKWDDAFVPYDSPGGYIYYNIHSGLNYQLLENHKWNKVYWEIPHVLRDKVTAIELRYRTQGNQREMTDTVKYYFDEIYLEKVEQPEHYEGWNVAPGHIAHNHIGYSTGYPKTALASDLSADNFTLIDVNTKKEALKKPVTVKETQKGTFQVLDFSEFDRSGTYVLKAGDVETRPFQINNFNDLYRSNLMKVINFFYTQRCGTEIPGRHSPCHSDFLCTHGDKTIVINGGWHDAGDLSQSVEHTSEAVYLFLSLAEKFKDSDPELSERLLEEGKWGLDWILKTRFGDGYRVNWAIMDFWTDGIIGTGDDVVVKPNHSPFSSRNDAFINFHAARAEARAAILLIENDPIIANYALRCAQEDWNFASESIQDMDIRTAGIALNASLTLYEATKDEKYKSAAISYGDYIIQCQQQVSLSDDVPLKGFFFEDTSRENIPFLRSISNDENFTTTGLVGLLQSFPDEQNVKKWESAIRLYANYYKDISAYTDPYFMLPAGIYDLNEAQDRIEVAKVKNGIPLNERYYIRSFPVWTTGRGNSSVVLSKAIGLAAIAEYLNDGDLLNLSYRQFNWFLGLNPFNQSIMWGEGYRYQALYNPLIGNIVGAVPCGIHTRFNGDAPYWPSDNWHNPKEIWTHSTSDWLWLMNYFFN
jgi:hypothetical protein